MLTPIIVAACLNSAAYATGMAYRSLADHGRQEEDRKTRLSRREQKVRAACTRFCVQAVT